jgi:PHD/YefM family antitoxin component YafN of YafNO toxin-antitoxin module
MKQIEITPELERILQQVNGDDVVFTRQGHAVALLSEVDDEELYWYARERDPAFLASMAKAREQVKQGHTVAHDELKRHLGIE